MYKLVSYIKNKMKERIYQLIAVQVLILLAVFAYNVLTPRTSVVWAGEDLASSTLVYGYVEDGALIYDIPYFSPYRIFRLTS